jgi:hypothetical protein
MLTRLWQILALPIDERDIILLRCSWAMSMHTIMTMSYYNNYETIALGASAWG